MKLRWALVNRRRAQRYLVKTIGGKRARDMFWCLFGVYYRNLTSAIRTLPDVATSQDGQPVSQDAESNSGKQSSQKFSLRLIKVRGPCRRQVLYQHLTRSRSKDGRYFMELQPGRCGTKRQLTRRIT